MNAGLIKLKELISMGIRLVSKEWEVVDERHVPEAAGLPEHVGFAARFKPTGKIYVLTVVERPESGETEAPKD